MEEKLPVELVTAFREAIAHASSINKRIITAAIIIIAIVSITFTATMVYFIHSYFYADYLYPEQTVENSNTNINMNGVD